MIRIYLLGLVIVSLPFVYTILINSLQKVLNKRNPEVGKFAEDFVKGGTSQTSGKK